MKIEFPRGEKFIKDMFDDYDIKFVLVEEVSAAVKKLLLFLSGVEHIDIALEAVKSGNGFLGAGEMNTKGAEWGSGTCEGAFGFSYPKGMSWQERKTLLAEIHKRATEAIAEIK